MEMYFTALVAPEQINKEVLKWKLLMQEKYGCTVALKSPAHITLIPPFWMKPLLENEMFPLLNAFSSYQNQFTVQLNGFSHFKPRTLFINVNENQNLNNLYREFYGFLTLNEKLPIIKDDHPFHPHFSNATRDLGKKSFSEAWEELSKIEYSAVWVVKSISVLKLNKKNWDVVFTSQFKLI